MVATADLSPNGVGRSGTGRSNGLWNLLPGTRTLAKRFLQRDLKARAKQSGFAFLSDNHQIFAAQTEFAGDVNSGLIGKSHSRLQHGFAAPHQVRMFVAIQANSMSNAMRKKFIIRSIASGSDYVARSV